MTEQQKHGLKIQFSSFFKKYGVKNSTNALKNLPTFVANIPGNLKNDTILEGINSFTKLDNSKKQGLVEICKELAGDCDDRDTQLQTNLNTLADYLKQ